MKSAATRPTVNLRRAYLESRYGQLHVRTAFPSTGGFDEKTPLVLLHECPHSSRGFIGFLSGIATDRSVYAADTPGYGESDPPPARPSIADYAAAIGDFLDNLRLRTVDVLGYQAGAAIAVELALARPAAIRKVVLAGLPLCTPAERARFEAAPYPAAPAADGSHLGAEWQRAAAEPAPGRGLAELAAEVAAALAPGAGAAAGLHALFAWPGAERLPGLSQPTLVMRPRDAAWEAAGRARPLVPRATWEDLPELGAGLFAVAPEDIAGRVRRFLDR